LQQTRKLNIGNWKKNRKISSTGSATGRNHYPVISSVSNIIGISSTTTTTTVAAQQQQQQQQNHAFP